MPRRDVVISGVSLVPHAGIADERDVGLAARPRWPATNSGRNLEPSSSAPSIRMVMSTGSEPVTAFQARQASTKVMTWPLSSQAPRALITLRPSGSVAMRGSKGGVSHRSADRPAARRNGRRTARAACAPSLARARRTSGCPASRAGRRRKAQRLQIRRRATRAARAAILGIGRSVEIEGMRSQREQPLEGGIEIGVDAGEELGRDGTWGGYPVVSTALRRGRRGWPDA